MHACVQAAAHRLLISLCMHLQLRFPEGPDRARGGPRTSHEGRLTMGYRRPRPKARWRIAAESGKKKHSANGDLHEQRGDGLRKDAGDNGKLDNVQKRILTYAVDDRHVSPLDGLPSRRPGP